MTPTQVDRFFDNYVLFESRTALQLGDQEFLSFGSRLERLQNLRRRLQMERRRLIGELAELARGEAAPEEGAVALRTKALDDLGQQSAEQIRQAYAEIDQVLSPRQRARFRIFEDNMERRKLELIALARQQTGANPPARPNQPPANSVAPNRRGGL